MLVLESSQQHARHFVFNEFLFACGSRAMKSILSHHQGGTFKVRQGLICAGPNTTTVGYTTEVVTLMGSILVQQCWNFHMNCFSNINVLLDTVFLSYHPMEWAVFIAVVWSPFAFLKITWCSSGIKKWDFSEEMIDQSIWTLHAAELLWNELLWTGNTCDSCCVSSVGWCSTVLKAKVAWQLI